MELIGRLGEWQHVDAGDGMAGSLEEDNIFVFDAYIFVVECGGISIVT